METYLRPSDGWIRRGTCSRWWCRSRHYGWLPSQNTGRIIRGIVVTFLGVAFLGPIGALLGIFAGFVAVVLGLGGAIIALVGGLIGGVIKG